MPQDTIQLGTLEDVMRNVPDTAVLYTELKNKLTEQENFKKKSEEYADWALPLTFLLLGIIWLLVRIIHGRNKGYVTLPGSEVDFENEDQVDIPKYQEFIEYDKNYTDKEISGILDRYHPWFLKMNRTDKGKFVNRVNKFIQGKIFRSYSGTKDRDIPVLVSAPAILFSFGLDDYLFKEIDSFDIYDQDFREQNNVHNELTNEYFIRVSIPVMLREIKGTFTGNISLVKAYALAFYHQHFENGSPAASEISSAYLAYEHEANRVFDKEKSAGGMIFESAYLRNFKEFWAGTAALFFENPTSLNSHYPALYHKMSLLLRQDPLSAIPQ